MDEFKRNKVNSRVIRTLVNESDGGGSSMPALAGSPARGSVGQVWVCPDHPDREPFVRRTPSQKIPPCPCGAQRILKPV